MLLKREPSLFSSRNAFAFARSLFSMRLTERIEPNRAPATSAVFWSSCLQPAPSNLQRGEASSPMLYAPCSLPSAFRCPKPSRDRPGECEYETNVDDAQDKKGERAETCLHRVAQKRLD